MKKMAPESIDLAFTQALDMYREMEPDTACAAIMRDWPEQIAVLLTEIILKTTCSNCGAGIDFIEYERDNGHGYYLVPICACEWRE